ncbi:MAG: YidB family protein [Woeseiaceae bacterium]
MGMLDTLLKNPEMLGDVAKFATENPELAKVAMDFFSSKDGAGLTDLVGSLQSGGLGDAVGSWLGNGENASVAPEQLESALGSDTISKFAEQAGVSGGEASSLLASILPQVVDKLSPDGALPDAGGLDNMLGSLMGRL